MYYAKLSLMLLNSFLQTANICRTFCSVFALIIPKSEGLLGILKNETHLKHV